MSTFEQLTGELFVLAEFQVTVAPAVAANVSTAV
jgi:hypothetical protein